MKGLPGLFFFLPYRINCLVNVVFDLINSVRAKIADCINCRVNVVANVSQINVLVNVIPKVRGESRTSFLPTKTSEKIPDGRSGISKGVSDIIGNIYDLISYSSHSIGISKVFDLIDSVRAKIANHINRRINVATNGFQINSLVDLICKVSDSRTSCLSTRV